MAGFNWEDEQDGEFRDMPEAALGGTPQGNITGAGSMSMVNQLDPLPQTRRPQVPQQQAVEQVYEQPETQVDEEAEYAAVLNDANLRIEQGTLYKLIMNHDIFEGRGEDPRAIENVQREIRKFAKERLEIMLGMRQDRSVQGMVSSPFNDLEVMILRKLASTYSKGATENQAAVKTATAVTKKEGLTPIGGAKPALRRPAPALAQKPIAAQAKAPIQRPSRAAEQMEEAYVPPTKTPDQVTPTDLLERNKQAAARQAGRKSARSTTSIPMPTADQEEMFQTQRVMTSENPLANSNVVSAIVASLNSNKSQ